MAGGKRARRTRGQSTLEYILVLVVILVAIIAFAAGALKPNVKKMLDQSGNTINAAADKVARGLNLTQ